MARIDLSKKSPELVRLMLRFSWGDKQFAGDMGEALARRCLHALGLQFEEVDQAPDTLHPELKGVGGKRPDFILTTETNEYIALVDAKHHDVGSDFFKLQVAEIGKYGALKAYVEAASPGQRVDVIFFVFPKCYLGQAFAAVWLEDILGGVQCEILGEPALGLDISGQLLDPTDGELIAPGTLRRAT